MSYKRPYFQKDLNPTPLELNFGEKHFTIKDDPSWLSPNLAPLHEDSVFSLHQLKATLTAVIKLDLRDYKEDAAKEKRIEPIRKARQAMLGFLAKSISKASEDVNKVKNAILRVTEPDSPSDPTKAMLQELRFMQIREIVRSTDIRKRPDMVRSKPEFLAALVNSPDDLLDQKHLEDLRRDYAFKSDPTLADLERDTISIAEAVRTRASEVNGLAVAMIREMGDFDDPISPMEHFQTFPVRSPHEQALADKMIRDYERKQEEIARKKLFDEKSGKQFDIVQNRPLPSMRQARR